MTTRNAQFGKELIPVHTIEEMVRVWDEFNRVTYEAFQNIAEQEARLKAVFGPYDHYSNFSPFPYQFTWSYERWKEQHEDGMKQVKSSVWSVLIDKIGLMKILSERRAEELKKSLENHTMPSITIEEILNFISIIGTNSRAMQDELLKEVYESLHPFSYKKYKTNGRYEINKRVVLSNMVHHNSYYQREKGLYSVDYRDQDRLTRIDRAFHLMDGKGIPDGYVSELVDAIQTSKTGTGKTEYFGFKCYMNQNLHLEFLRTRPSKAAKYHWWKRNAERRTIMKYLYERGDQVAFVPLYADGNVRHEAVEYGFVTSEYLGNIYVRYWTKESTALEPELRTTANSILTVPALLIPYHFTTQDKVEEALRKYCQ